MMKKLSAIISEEDCYKVLKNHYQDLPVKLLSYSLAPISEDVNGYMGEHLILKMLIENGEKTELRFFAKTLLVEHEAIAEFARTGNMFNKEVGCYKFLEEVKRLHPKFDVSFYPKYYHSRENEFIILEDIAEKGYKMWNGPLELDLEHLKLSLKSTAKFHAASFVLEEIKSKKLGRRYSLLEDYGEFLDEGLYKNDPNYLGYQYIMTGARGLCSLIDLLPENGLPKEEFKSKLKSLVEQVFENIKPNNKFRHIWTHGDLWTKNVMFQYKDGKVTNCQIFDFQLQRYSLPSNDVLFMIYQTTDRKMRQKHFHYLLDYYYDALNEELAKAGLDITTILHRDEFYNSVIATFPMVKLTKAIYKSLSGISKKYHNQLISDPDLYGHIMFKDRSDFITDVFHNDKSYRNIITILLEDLRDLLSHQKITIEDCYQIIKQKLEKTDYNLIEYNAIPFAEKTGFLGEHLKLKIKIKLPQDDAVREFNFFVKGIPAEAVQRTYVIDTYFFFKEMKFFTEIVPKILKNEVTTIKDCIPELFLARLNDVLVFEDYTRKDYATLNCREAFDYNTVVIVIKKLAKLHAAALILEEKLSTSSKKYRLYDCYSKELCETHYSGGKESLCALESFVLGTQSQIDLFSDLCSGISLDLFKKRARNAIYKMLERVKPSKKFRNTICHGDLWSNNILLKFENGNCVDCVFVDFQSTRYNPPAHDVLSFLYISTNRVFRKKYMQEILSLYHREISKILSDYGVDVNDVVSYEEFLESCDELKKYVIPQTVSYFQIVMLTSDQVKELFSKPELNSDFFFKDRGPLLSKLCAEDCVYREKMREALVELREFCIECNDLD